MTATKDQFFKPGRVSATDKLATTDKVAREIMRKQALGQFGINNIKTGVALSQLEEKLVPLYLFHRYQVEALHQGKSFHRLPVQTYRHGGY